ncbi:DegT/DnrJ/EryC1/StrS family aminotransferase [Micromonospora olivasterospora]|uniref:dTDP-4-amino-4,6-dideoxygalactose transaminase n=1 Tax=Micromonospora olivasterospora TaxID=1880 RepID=A0A562I3S3_MICOL|nr:DegT/DnrJ/EryC1/StrS family aminotransferase [Micromonospora olivasterospora]TWH65697.1 dTDP-4-amino-4,6-dideoxygalactose transaminase [Micromonospora olivasterospora]
MTDMPAALGGRPVVRPDNEPGWPLSGAIEKAALAEITDSGQWVGFSHIPAKWRAILEQVVAATTGHRYGIGQPNGTLAIASGIRAQLRSRGPQWARGRDQVLVADLTHASAHHGVRLGVASELGRAPELVAIDARPDATMDAECVAGYLGQHANRVLAVVPATMYGNFGPIEQIVRLAEDHDVVVHHDNALGGAARYDGRHAVTASISGHGEGKATPSCEGGLVVTSDPDVAALVRADTDCGNAPARLDPIPYADFGPIPAGNQRMGEQPAALMLIQWLRAMHSRLQVRENRRLVTELAQDSALFPVPVLKVPPVDAEYPPFFCLHMECTDELETELGLTPDDLRVALTAEGIWAEAGFIPTHLDPAWQDQITDVGFTYAGSKRVYERAIFMHNKYLRHPDFPVWLAEILQRIRDNAGKLAGISESIPESDRHRVTNPFVRKAHP